MPSLRLRMLEDMQLHGYAERTQEAYLREVRKLAEFYKRSPAKILEEEIRKYFLYLVNEKGFSASGCRIARCGIKFFFEKTLKREWTIFDLVKPKRRKSLPVVLSREEVADLLRHVDKLHYQTCLSAIYSCGFRLQEGTHLRVDNIDSARMVVHVTKGKGSKERYVPLPESTLALLRRFWKTHRNPTWIFPAPGKGGKERPTAQKPMPYRSLQEAFGKALRASSCRKKASCHSLRHSYATHLMEDGVSQRLIQLYLGHRSSKTTEIYTHLTTRAFKKSSGTINQIMDDVLPGLEP